MTTHLIYAVDKSEHSRRVLMYRADSDEALFDLACWLGWSPSGDGFQLDDRGGVWWVKSYS